MKYLLLIMATWEFSTFTGLAQNQEQDKTVIEGQIDLFFKDWENHNFDNMVNYATEDSDWVNVVGMWWKNRKEVIYAHNVFHKVMFRNTKLTKTSVHTRFITKDVAVVRLYWHMGEYTTPSGNHHNEAENIAMMVFVKKAEKWLLTATENLVIEEAAQKSNPVNRMPKE